MRAHKKQRHWHPEQKFFGRGVLGSVIDLFPEVQVVVGAGVEFEGHAAHVVEHEVGERHVGEVCEGPGGLDGDGGVQAEEEFEEED